MIKRKRLQHAHPAQAIVEFALIITVLLMIIFIIIESGRILWAWNQVQNAAREGARYAITGQEELSCPFPLGTKFHQTDDPDDQNKRNACASIRTASIINRAHTSLSGLRLNEVSTAFEDDNYYNIEVWGLNEFGELQYDFGGLPNQPVIVRVTYQVPIITPLLRPIAQRVPVFGQVTLNNESFGQQSSQTAGQGLPPVVPSIPTAGVTPSPTPSPTPTDTPTIGPSLTPTNTSTPENTPTATVSICPTRFEGPAVAGTTNVIVTGDPGTIVELIDIDTGATLVTTTLKAVPDHACGGFADFIPPSHPKIDPPLVAGHLLLIRNLDDGSFDETFVIGGTPTNTPTATNTPANTPTPSSTPTATPTHTPSAPYIIAIPTCSSNSTASFTVAGFNWPLNETITLYWNTTQFQEIVGKTQHNGSFTRIWTI
ncbi:MAG: pilus assembly protein, partial [Anaerolineales bacterium]|nr:pilus assembly protein [Anaerolineales bacterium]